MLADLTRFSSPLPSIPCASHSGRPVALCVWNGICADGASNGGTDHFRSGVNLDPTQPAYPKSSSAGDSSTPSTFEEIVDLLAA